MGKILTSKLLNEYLKKKWTASDFASYLGCSEDRFWQLLKKQFNGSALKSFMTRLAANETFKKKLTKTSHDETTPIEDSTSSTEHDSIEITTTTLIENQDTFFEPDVPVESIPRRSTRNTSAANSLERLMQQKQETADRLKEYQLQNERYASEYLSISSELESHQQELKELEFRINQCKDEIKQLTKKLDSSQKSRKNTELQIDSTLTFYEKILDEIQKNRKVSILVYASGEIDFDSKTPIEFTDWESCYQTLLAEESLETLTIKQIKALAKVISLVKVLKNEERLWDVTFEDTISEQYFSNLA